MHLTSHIVKHLLWGYRRLVILDISLDGVCDYHLHIIFFEKPLFSNTGITEFV